MGQIPHRIECFERMLKEQAKVSREIQTPPGKAPAQDPRDRLEAQVWLCARYRKLVARGKNKNIVVVVAIARELVAFMWDIAHHVHLKPAR